MLHNQKYQLYDGINSKSDRDYRYHKKSKAQIFLVEFGPGKLPYHCFIEPLAHVINNATTKLYFQKNRRWPNSYLLMMPATQRYSPITVLYLLCHHFPLVSLIYSKMLWFINEYTLLYSHQCGLHCDPSPYLGLICLVGTWWRHQMKTFSALLVLC